MTERNKTESAEAAPRTAEDTTIAEMLDTVRPPREGTTGAHIVSVPPAYLVVIQGPEAQYLTARVLDYIEAMRERADEVHARAAEEAGEES